MKTPSLSDAQSFLTEAESRNPGPWVGHSSAAAQAAGAIASQFPGLHPETAFIFGLLHDIGRGAGVSGLHHILDGYRFLIELGYDDAARICITHSFPIKNIHAVEGNWDCSDPELEFIKDILDRTEYNDYDRLIQLCDAIALPDGYCLMEKRLFDVTLRYGVHEFTVQKWKAYLQIQSDFEAVLGKSIYSLLPGVEENTFRIKIHPAEK